MPEQLLNPDNALGMLRQEHENIKSLLLELQKVEEPGMEQQILVPLLDELKAHSAIELELFYPFIRQFAGEDHVEAAADEFDSVADLATNMDEMIVTDPAFKETLASLIQHFDRHCFEMEQYLFLTVEGPNCSPDCLDSLVVLANDMKARKADLLRKMGGDSSVDARQRIAQEKGRGVHAPRDLPVSPQEEETLFGGKTTDLGKSELSDRDKAVTPNEFDTARGYSPPPPNSDISPDLPR